VILFMVSNSVSNDFLYNLLQAAEWTAARAEDFDFIHGCYGTVFRSINPLIQGNALYHIKSGYTTWQIDDLAIANFQAALDVVRQQRQPIRTEAIHYKELLATGRVLCFELLATTHDTIAIEESQGFMDESDVPPIDTWFALHDRTLFCFIPNQFEAIVQAAMRIQIIRCYDWLDEAEPKLYQRLKGLLP
jgi:hypothetical protein